MSWNELTEEQRAGMTEDYWKGLPEANRQAFLERLCVEGDGRPRALGSPYCEAHLSIHQVEWRQC